MEETLSNPNYEAWGIEPIDSKKCSEKELYTHLAAWATLAPSSHNTQPWKFVIRPSKHTIDICLDASHILPASDKLEREAYVSIGCATENLLLASDYYGLDPLVEYTGEKYPSPAIQAQFKEGILNAHREGEGQDQFLRAMKTRKMNRSKYDPLRTVPPILMKEINEVVQDFGIALDLVIDAGTRSAIAELQYTATKLAVADADFRKELGYFLLPNDTDKGRAMPGHTFGLSNEMAVKVFNALNREGSFDPDIAHGFAASERDAIRSAPLVCVLSTRKNSPEWWLKTGRALERIALLAEIQGVNIAVHAALVEKDMFTNLLKLRLGISQYPTALFRVGYATEERRHSPRVSIREVVEYED